jgi:23S rRNA (pseudouridine1915-N3)-methyltransferase
MFMWRSAPESSSFTRLVSQPVRMIVLGEGRLRAPYEDDVAHYARLLSRYTRLELIETRDSAAVARRVPSEAFVSLLAAEGSVYDSQRFSEFLQQRRRDARDLVFVIGGPFGPPQLERVDHRLSLGRMTMPHQLARVVLLEQIYRAHKILAGEPYHY